MNKGAGPKGSIMFMEKPPYLVRHRNQWRYLPPKQAVDDGFVNRAMLGNDTEAAYAYATENNLKLKEWQQWRQSIKAVTSSSVISLLVESYLASADFAKLAETTKVGYRQCLMHWQMFGNISHTQLNKMKVNELTPVICQKIYNKMAGVSVSTANNCLSVWRLLFAYAIRNGYCQFNPFTPVKKQTVKARRVVWEREHVRAYLNVAYTHWKTRSIGLIVHMAYELAQRSTDMRLLKWSNYNEIKGVIVVIQSKRGSRVELPVSKGLQQMLAQQKIDFGWQEYVAPSLKRDGKQGLLPYTLQSFNKAATKLMEEAKLPEELTIRDLRRTAVTEMIEEGVPLPSISSMTGHASLTSLTPYVRHTLKGAMNAQAMRNYPDYLLESIE